MLSGSFCLKVKNKLKLNYENINKLTFDSELIKFTNKKKKLQNKKKILKKVIINNNKI